MRPSTRQHPRVTLTIVARPRVRLLIHRTRKFMKEEKPGEARECRTQGSNSRPAAGTPGEQANRATLGPRRTLDLDRLQPRRAAHTDDLPSPPNHKCGVK